MINRRKFLAKSLTAVGGAALGLGLGRSWAYGLIDGVFSHQIAMSGFLNGGSLAIMYQTMYSNQPASYGNTLMLWQGSRVPYDESPMLTHAITSDNPMGSLLISNASITTGKTYILGYATGSAATTVCATLVFYAGRHDGAVFCTQVNPLLAGSEAITVDYITPTGNLPATHGNWVAIWKGSTPNYDGSGILAQAQVAGDAASGSLTLEDLPLELGTTYTVGYFMGPSNTDLAATTTMTL